MYYAHGSDLAPDGHLRTQKGPDLRPKIKGIGHTQADFEPHFRPHTDGTFYMIPRGHRTPALRFVPRSPFSVVLDFSALHAGAV